MGTVVVAVDVRRPVLDPGHLPVNEEVDSLIWAAGNVGSATQWIRCGCAVFPSSVEATLNGPRVEAPAVAAGSAVTKANTEARNTTSVARRATRSADCLPLL